MNATVAEQFEIIRRIIDRLQHQGESVNCGIVCDLADHLRTEVGYLRGYVEEELRKGIVDATGQAVRAEVH